MIKERLEEIRERVLVDKVYYKYLDGTKGRWGKTYTLNEEDYDHLIEQAERSIAYDNKLISIEDNKQYVSELLEQNKRYREALEFYADERNYKERDFGMIVQPAIQDGDRGRTAREALEAIE